MGKERTIKRRDDTIAQLNNKCKEVQLQFDQLQNEMITKSKALDEAEERLTESQDNLARISYA